ncbi:hypothetical protein C1Y63_06995 [Corynebacterium sp. 13CS0277]|uniref:hypothetical protein n=1 Tax=Corynebacterium sp. 13CS0277 TaxID=2071994 RepID=UPI000D040AB4|nr:hypothetical protein [Corynebacterium sp. 13CS0277]PRQ11291.1 hypothetical protein C1Y63_06995 [Corynebacterium sp. 13CS0277]
MHRSLRALGAATLAAGLIATGAAPAHAGYTTAPTTAKTCEFTPDAAATKAYQDLYVALRTQSENAITATLTGDLGTAYAEYFPLHRRATYSKDLSAAEKTRVEALATQLRTGLAAQGATEDEIANVLATGEALAKQVLDSLQSTFHGYLANPKEDTDAEVARLAGLQPEAAAAAATPFGTFAPKHSALFAPAFAGADVAVATTGAAYAKAAGPGAFAAALPACRTTTTQVTPAKPDTTTPAKDTTDAANSTTQHTDTQGVDLSSYKGMKSMQAVMVVVTLIVAVLSWLGLMPRF